MDNKATIKDEDEMPPELEDFSEELQKIRLNRGEQGDNSEIKVKVVEKEDVSNKSIGTNKSSSSNNTTLNQPEEEEFGSFMKKGFFRKNNQNSNSTNSSSKSQVEDLTHIKSSKEKKDPKIFDQVKKEIEVNRESANSNEVKSSLENIVNKKDEWLNQELLMKIAQKPNLMKAFMDPRFGEVISLMQKDPKEAISKFGHVKEFNDFIKEFSGVMADHFGKLGKDKEKSDGQNNSMNYDPETEEILKDPKISPILYKLQTEGKLDIEEIQNDKYISTRINKLIDKGVLKIQRESELNK